MSSDTDWLAHTYPATDLEGAAGAVCQGQERTCLLRLEALRWPDDPVCPKCGERTDTRWNNAPRRLGWRCKNPSCGARFHVLQVIPGLARMHHDVTMWFRAAYLVMNNGRMTVSAFSLALGVNRYAARSLLDSIDELKRCNPLLLERVVSGPSGDAALLRAARKRRA